MVTPTINIEPKKQPPLLYQKARFKFIYIFKTKELEKNSVVAKNATTASDGKVYQVEYFNLDAIISVGYRVNSTIIAELTTDL